MAAMDLAGKTVIVAGASSGMGRAVAMLAAEAGAALVLIGRDAGRLAETVQAARASAAGNVTAVVADAASAEGLAAAFAPHEALINSADVLVNSIGTNIVERTFDQLTPGSWHGMIESNLTAAFNLSQVFVPAMRRRGGGLLIHIASTAARKPDRSGAAYQASKAGVLALTHAIMEEEWENGIRATAILPGMTDTPLLDRRPTPVSAEARQAALQPNDIAEACLFVMRLPARAHVSEIQIQPSRR